uniref:Uncharacterized protein n=1 Tax=Tetranychus urticae TaxID=32264 RepID=T1KQ76_TETUR
MIGNNQTFQFHLLINSCSFRTAQQIWREERQKLLNLKLRHST